jgi:hypothetical protein
MFDAQSLVDLSKKGQKQIVVAIRLAAALAEKGRSICRYEVAVLCRVSELDFAKVHEICRTFRHQLNHIQGQSQPASAIGDQ